MLQQWHIWYSVGKLTRRVRRLRCEVSCLTAKYTYFENWWQVARIHGISVKQLLVAILNLMVFDCISHSFFTHPVGHILSLEFDLDLADQLRKLQAQTDPGCGVTGFSLQTSEFKCAHWHYFCAHDGDYGCNCKTRKVVSIECPKRHTISDGPFVWNKLHRVNCILLSMVEPVAHQT